MNATISRRLLLRRIGLVAGVWGAAPLRAWAADQPHLSTSDPTALALGYTEDASTVDAGKSPTYRPGQKCSNCMQNSGAPGQPWGPCSLYPGKLVNEDGWCRAYVKKS